jgi:hypothetical protein
MKFGSVWKWVGIGKLVHWFESSVGTKMKAHVKSQCKPLEKPVCVYAQVDRVFSEKLGFFSTLS